MSADERARRWRQVWEDRRRRILGLDAARDLGMAVAGEALAIVDEAKALAAVADPRVHATAPVDALIARVNALPDPLPLLLHRPVANGLSMLRMAAQELLTSHLPEAVRRRGEGRPGRFDWFLVVGDDAEIVELARDCGTMLAGTPAVHVASTERAALDELGHEGRGIVVTGLVLPADRATAAPPGLRVAKEARHRRHAVLVVTAASDYLAYWPRLPAAGLTGHDVVVKTWPDFAARFVRRVLEIADPRPVRMSLDEGTGHLVRIGDVEVPHLDAREDLVLRHLDHRWRTAADIAASCADETDRAPAEDGVLPVISRLRHELSAALVAAESTSAQVEVIQTQRRAGERARYRLAPWLLPDDCPLDMAGAAPDLPAVLVVEDDRDWARWVVDCLGELCWPASVASTPDDARRALEGELLPVVVADLGLDDVADPEVGLALIEDVVSRRPGARVVVLSAFGGRDTLLARLFASGVRTVDVIDKAAGREACRAALLASMQRAADEVWRGVRRGREPSPVHRVVRLSVALIEIDGVRIERLSRRESRVLDELFRHANQPVTAEALEDLCYPDGAGSGSDPLVKVQLTISRLRKKIDRSVGRSGTGKSVIRTRHRARSTYELRGVVTDRVARAPTW